WPLLSPEECLPSPCYCDGPVPSVGDLLCAGLLPWSFQSPQATQQAPLGWMPKGLMEALLSKFPSGTRHQALFLQEPFQWQGLGPGLFIDQQRLRLVEQKLADLLGPFGWRHENFAVIDRAGLPPLPDLQLERSLFRWLGLLSESVQLNIRREDGSLWIAQRAMTKAIDPGLWDAAVAGGLSAGEPPEEAVQRESFEEAGLTDPWHKQIQRAAAPCMRIARLVAPPMPPGSKAPWPEPCLHHERVWRFEITIPNAWQPSANDGEVMAFRAVKPEEIFSLWQRGEFNHEAACASP
ncbi:MAG: NUDIX domain-containing protein, partial [Burkholderiaceae bacterium]